MRTLDEIERAVDGLTDQQKRELHRYLEDSLQSPASAKNGHSVLDIPAVHLGAILQPPGPGDDVLGEMLEGRP